MIKRSLVVIVGRMNVGKSTLFNRLSSNVKSLTLDYSGVTRDSLKDTVEWLGHSFELADTAGISLRKSNDPLFEKIREKALALVLQADVVIFVIDGSVGIMPEDQEIARFLHKNHKRVIIAINKVDNLEQEHIAYGAEQLGGEVTVLLSAVHGKGINNLLDEIVARLSKKTTVLPEEPTFKVMFLGKPNVGKSSLMNALLKQERSIVSEQPGTTREAISEKITFYKEAIKLTDTPGIRRKRSVSGELEPLMVKSSFQALKDSNIVVLLLDGSEGHLADQELKLAFYAFTDQYKALVILINKEDISTELSEQELQKDLEFYRAIVKKIPVMHISCKTGKNIGRVLPLIKEIWERYNQRFSDEEINRLLISSLQRKPLYHQSELLRLYKALQVRTAPPTFELTVNEPDWF
ncbi:MAG TPA: ribosome biogenesis GTPase Der, partial [Candidatus Babeliaceae bacterium]|nr:ribosome biogenesis GTPase Der [Candidatus Babeliaceae bacterium]